MKAANVTVTLRLNDPDLLRLIAYRAVLRPANRLTR